MIYEVSQRTIVRSRREKQFVRVVNMSSFAFCGGGESLDESCLSPCRRGIPHGIVERFYPEP